MEKREQQQRSAFTKFVNSTLIKGGYDTINDAVDDIKDGFYLSHFLMVMKAKGSRKNSGKPGGDPTKLLLEKNPKLRYACYNNLNSALKFITDDGIQFVNISAEDLYDGNIKLCLGLIFTLSLFYLTDGSSSGGMKELIEWVNKILAEHRDEFGVENIRNFDQSPQIADGRVFKVLNHHFADDGDRDKMSNFEKEPGDRVKHFDDSLSDANKFLDIPVLLEGKEMDSPDDKAVMVQILQYKQLDNKQDQDKYLKDQLNKKLQKALEAKEKAKAINVAIQALMEWIKERTKELNDQPGDLHPDKIPELQNFVDKHFNTDKPDKTKEYKQIAEDVAKLKSDCIANKISIPRTGMTALNADWGNLANSERDMIGFIQKMNAIYQKLIMTERVFQRKLANCANNNATLKADSEAVSEKSKKATLAELGELEIKLELIDGQQEMANEEQDDFENFVQNKVNPACPNKEYFQEKFGKPLEGCKQDLEGAKGCAKKSHSDYDAAQARLKDVKANLSKNARVLASSAKLGGEADALIKEESTVKYLENLEEIADELRKVNDKLDASRSDLNGCKERDEENTKICGSPVENPYTTHTADERLEATGPLTEAINNKLESLNGERERLTKLEAKYKDFNDKKDKINSNLDTVNAKIDEVNSSDKPNDEIKAKLHETSVEVEAVVPQVDQLQSNVSDLPDLVNECRQLSTRCATLLTTIKQHINVLDSKPAVTDDEIKLTDEEQRKIKGLFATADTDNKKALIYMQFTTVAISFTPLGINNIAEQSLELKEFFTQYSSNKSTITLDELFKGYLEYKVNFTVKNKDQVLKLLSDKADSDNHISENNLKATVSPAIFDKIQSSVSPIQKDGKNFYPLSELIM